MPRAEEIARGEKRKGSGSRGSVKNGERLRNLFNHGEGRRADWGSVDPGAIASTVEAVTGRGGAISFGTSRDGGAYSVTLFLDGERETLWFNGDADVEGELENIRVLIGSLV